MHYVVTQIIGLYGPECSQADVQRHASDLDSACDQLLHDTVRKMESGGGSCNGTFVAGIDGLVAVFIRLFHQPLNVWWQRDGAKMVNHLGKRSPASPRQVDDSLR